MDGDGQSSAMAGSLNVRSLWTRQRTSRSPHILTDLNVEVTDSEEILLEEEYVVPWEEIHQTRVSSGGGRVEIVNDDPDGSKVNDRLRTDRTEV